MQNPFSTARYGPIGLDIGSRSVKLAQFSADRKKLIDVSRSEIVVASGDEASAEEIAAAVERARAGKRFYGSRVVVCLSDRQLFLQNVRVPKNAVPTEMDRSVVQEAASRLPYPLEETELRYLEAADVRHGESLLREVIVLACHRPKLHELLGKIEKMGLQPAAVDVEPLALLRAGTAQYRREEDRGRRSLFVHIGRTRTTVVIAQDDDPLFIKYIDIGGKQFDEAVARHLKMDQAAAVALRRQTGDRRTDQHDPEVERSLNDAMRPTLERLAGELTLCIRYHGVTFRGRPLEMLVLGGGEASPWLVDTLHKRLDLRCELSDPFRGYAPVESASRPAQWDVACGLALWEVQA